MTVKVQELEKFIKSRLPSLIQTSNNVASVRDSIQLRHSRQHPPKQNPHNAMSPDHVLTRDPQAETMLIAFLKTFPKAGRERTTNRIGR